MNCNFVFILFVLILYCYLLYREGRYFIVNLRRLKEFVIIEKYYLLLNELFLLFYSEIMKILTFVTNN